MERPRVLGIVLFVGSLVASVGFAYSLKAYVVAESVLVTESAFDSGDPCGDSGVLERFPLDPKYGPAIKQVFDGQRDFCEQDQAIIKKQAHWQRQIATFNIAAWIIAFLAFTWIHIALYREKKSAE